MFLSMIADWLNLQATVGPFTAIERRFNLDIRLYFLRQARPEFRSLINAYARARAYAYLPVGLLIESGFRELTPYVLGWDSFVKLFLG